MLDSCAAKRATSIYLASGTIPMFPWQLAGGPMSLLEGCDCYAMSFGIDLDNSGMPQGDPIITPSSRSVNIRSVVDETECTSCHDEQQREAELAMLYTLAQRHRQWRLSQGAIEINLPECNLKVDDVNLEQPEIAFERVDWASPARQLVAECMIMASGAAGSFGAAEQVALPYRGQRQPVLPAAEDLESIFPGPSRLVAIRSRMTPSITEPSPSPHASLGLQAYVQVTSPIRRYSDLVAHYQLKAHVAGQKLPFTHEGIRDITNAVGSRVKSSVRLSRESDRYWVAQYFQQQPQEAVFSAVFLRWLREDSRLGIVLVEDIAREIPIKMQRNVQLGEPLFIKCIDVDAPNLTVKLAEAKMA
ncbi:hypothetical protein CYMTET_25000 [Cymbomonas tetramitiformis]|uniref:RNB domain-containing protein n=1 Tax=Cymbomonas tetramitiformis TaxID=36881 RepID=A0AAE0FVH2_9CHLO|nr:hypothetical protein CYMTET_25000 [Cymbomonas tetramitiformis]